MRYCAVTVVETRVNAIGSEMWVLRHACGKEEQRLRRKRNQRHQTKAPTRVKCDDAPSSDK